MVFLAAVSPSESTTLIDPLVPLRERVLAATRAAFGDAAAGVDAALHRSQHADYQADLALALARALKKNPREVAAAIAAQIAADDLIAAVEVAGPGFLNLSLRPTYLAGEIEKMRGAPERLAIPRVTEPDRVVIDYSAPNVAKEMHVGHLRSTIIGDSLARLLEWQGHTVIRRNHVGDWGTPFGMLIEHLVDLGAGADAGVRELGSFYRAARVKFDGDPDFADRARARVVSLQSGDAETLALWRTLVGISVQHFTELYALLGVTLSAGDVVGESAYNSLLADVVDELVKKGIARESQGAMCVFLPGFTGRDGEPVPLIVRKQEGGYTYATTDLAALRQRTLELHANRLVYVIGAPQAQHLAMLFATARLAGWPQETTRLEHVAFGSVLGPDKKMLKTRAGDSVALSELLNEAVTRAAEAIEEKSADLPPDEQQQIARAVGIGAVKYADLSNDRVKDYVFDWNRMLAFEGNTGPYLMYAHARIRSILRKAAEAGDAPGPIALDAPAERALALALLQLPATLARAAESLQPHRICAFLYEVASAFTGFYENCPVLKAEQPTRGSRIALVEVTARTLALGLQLLGISAPERM